MFSLEWVIRTPLQDPAFEGHGVLAKLLAHDDGAETMRVVGAALAHKVPVLELQAYYGSPAIIEYADSMSQQLYDLFTRLFTRRGETRSTLGVDFAAQLLLYGDVQVHPSFAPVYAHFVASLGRLHDTDAMLVFPRSVLAPLTDGELAQMGFAKLSRTPYVFRHVANVTRFDEQRAKRPAFKYDDALVRKAAKEFAPTLTEMHRSLVESDSQDW